MNVKPAIRIITGTKTPVIWSTSRATGGLEFCASLTSRLMAASRVSSPTLAASTSSEPSILSVPADTPLPLTKGIASDSPVSRDSSAELFPSTTMPSTGKFSPGRILSCCPGSTSATGTRRSSSLSISVTNRGVRSYSFCIARDALVRAFISSALPRLTKPITNKAASKN